MHREPCPAGQTGAATPRRRDDGPGPAAAPPPPPRSPSGWIIIPATILLLLALPVALPLASLSVARDRRAMRGAIHGIRCTRCGMPLDPSAIELAGRLAADRVTVALARGVIPRLAPAADAVCPGCGAAFRFRDRRFHPADGGPPAGTALTAG